MKRRKVTSRKPAKKKLKKSQKYAFKLIFAKAFFYVFKTKSDRDKAIRQIKEALRKASLTRADFFIGYESYAKGRGMRVLKGGRRA